MKIGRVLCRIGGVASGSAIALACSHLLATRARAGIPPSWLFAAAFCAISAYALARRVRRGRWKLWVRSTAFTAAALLTSYSLIGWEGHAGGYWEASRMFGHLMYVAEDVPDNLPSAEELQHAVEDFHSRTGDTFRSTASPTQTDAGWSLVIAHPESHRVCAVYRGGVAPWPAELEGRAACRLPVSWVWLGTLAVVALVGALPVLIMREKRRGSSGTTLRVG